MTFLAAVAAVLAISFAVPVVVYGVFSSLSAMKPPADLELGPFLITVAVEKAGVATAFVGFLALAGDELRDAWLAYSALWVLMFVVSEIVEVRRGSQTGAEALAGALSEAVYFPLAGLAASSILG